MARQGNLARRNETDIAMDSRLRGNGEGSVPAGRSSAARGLAATAGKRPLELDRLIHEPVRLRIVSALIVNDALSFNDLKKLLDTTDGNLSVHARKLEEAGYVTCNKFFDQRVPKTEYRLTPAGRKALERYIDHLEALIRPIRER
ncbi:MAG TPA: transcriptional regulator [Terriglobia bacterium]|nr:transcriptional regulator [Terriglobia bacterium]